MTLLCGDIIIYHTLSGIRELEKQKCEQVSNKELKTKEIFLVQLLIIIL